MMRKELNMPGTESMDEVVSKIEEVIKSMDTMFMEDLVRVSTIKNAYKSESGKVSILVRFETGINEMYQKRDLFIYIIRDYKFATYNVIVSNDQFEGLDILYSNFSQNPIIGINKYLPVIIKSVEKTLVNRK